MKATPSPVLDAYSTWTASPSSGRRAPGTLLLAPLLLCFLLAVPHASLAQELVQLRNRHQADSYIQSGARGVTAGPLGANPASAVWAVEPVTGTEFVRLRSTARANQYLHVENGPLALSETSADWWSSHWTFEPVPNTNFFRIRNRHQADQYLHIENGPLQSSVIEDNWWSSHWEKIEAGKTAPVAFAVAEHWNDARFPYVPRGVNLGGGDFEVNRLRTGRYEVTFEGLGSSGRSWNAQVNARSGSSNATLTTPKAVCRLEDVRVTADVTVQVGCEDPATGAAKNAEFSLLVVGNDVLGGTGASNQSAAFSLHNKSSDTRLQDYAPLTASAWNTSQVKIGARSGEFDGSVIGHRHTAMFSRPQQVVMISVWGDLSGRRCINRAMTASESDVVCFDRARGGEASKTVTHTLLRTTGGRADGHTGFAHVDGSNGTVYQAGAFNSAGKGIAGRKTGTGKYTITWTGLDTSTYRSILVTPAGGTTGQHCTHWLVSDSPATVVDVACFNLDGKLADADPAFQVLVIK